MWDLALGLYLVNATLMINHEIDSAYWKEWDLFGLKGGMNLFLALHLPVVFVLLWGVLLVARQSMVGVVLSLILAAGGMIAFGIHTYFLKKGRPEFDTWASKALLVAMLAVSLVQAGVCIALFSGR